MKKSKAIIQKVRSKYWQRTKKNGIKTPKSVPEALEIDKQNGNHIWVDSVNKEIPKIKNAVDEYNSYPSNLIGYKKIIGHMVFNVNMGKNVFRNTIFVADGHKTEMPSSITYSMVMSQDYFRIFRPLQPLTTSMF